MANLILFAENLLNLNTKGATELILILKEEYGIVPATLRIKDKTPKKNVNNKKCYDTRFPQKNFYSPNYRKNLWLQTFSVFTQKTITNLKTKLYGYANSIFAGGNYHIDNLLLTVAANCFQTENKVKKS